jgi:hypothetical protein
MALNIWISHGEEWLALEKVNFNGVTKEITVNSDVTELNIRSDVYSAWVRWFEREENRQYLPAIRFTGLDPIPGGFTGDTYFLINGWKLKYDANVVAISGVLYSDDYDTPYWSAEDKPIFPATVSALVNTAVTKENVVTGDLSSLPSQTDIATAVWSRVLESNLSAEELVRLMTAMLTGKVSGAGTGTEVFRDLADTKDRVIVTVDDVGNRTAVVRDGA